MSKFQGHKYTWSKPFTCVQHKWEFRGPIGAIGFQVTISLEPRIFSCGLEFHHSRAAKYRCDDAPDHIDCYLLGEPCWHDGTSLYAEETVWPKIEHALRRGEHETIFQVLENEYDRHFNRLELK